MILKINQKYNSIIVEESIDDNYTQDYALLNTIKNEYVIGQWVSANNKIQQLLNKYKNTHLKNQIKNLIYSIGMVIKQILMKNLIEEWIYKMQYHYLN